MEKVAIYCRLSEEDRNKKQETDDSNSIQNQKAMLLEYSIQQGWEVYNIYSDDNYTGSDRNRPEFKRLLDDAEAHKFDIVLCKSQSRFTRELELVEKYINGLFPIWGIRFISIVDNADTANKGNKKSRQINGLVNEWYLEDMSDKFHISRSYLSKKFKAVTGFGFKEYIVNVRIKNACRLLLETNKSITDIAFECGFNDSNYFGDAFRHVKGVSPNKYRKNKEAI